MAMNIGKTVLEMNFIANSLPTNKRRSSWRPMRTLGKLVWRFRREWVFASKARGDESLGGKRGRTIGGSVATGRVWFGWSVGDELAELDSRRFVIELDSRRFEEINNTRMHHQASASSGSLSTPFLLPPTALPSPAHTFFGTLPASLPCLYNLISCKRKNNYNNSSLSASCPLNNLSFLL
nr:hypothetical protein Itr_chr10CG14530 [Ipomoea trifida]